MPFSLKAMRDAITPIYTSLTTMAGYPPTAPPTTAPTAPAPTPESPPRSWTPEDTICRSRNPSGEASAQKDWNSPWLMVEHTMVPPAPKDQQTPRPKQTYPPPSSAIPGSTPQRALSPDAQSFLQASPPTQTAHTRPLNPDHDPSVRCITKNHDTNLALHTIILSLMRSAPIPTLHRTSPQEAERQRARWYGRMAEEAQGKVLLEGIELDAIEMAIFLKCVMVAWEREGARVEEEGRCGKGVEKEKEWERGIEFEWEKGDLIEDTELIKMGKLADKEEGWHD